MAEQGSPNSAPAPNDAAPSAPAAPAARAPRRPLRSILLLAGPIVALVVGAYVYYTSGRVVETDNAYVKADVGVISAEVAGPIAALNVHENDRVEAGDVLFTIDDRSFRVALDRGNAQLAAINDFVESTKASYRQSLEQLALARTNAAYEQRELDRLTALAERKLASEVDVDEQRHDRDVANQEIQVTERALDAIRARLGGDLDRPVTEQAAYLAAKSMRDAAELDLEHTVVRAPFGGIASQVPTVGHHVQPGTPVMTIVADRGVWIEANFKETDLTHVAVGQPVDIRLDTYPDRRWSGRVESISQATGAEFSVIPAQNATGNWVKVAQRIPVRIAIDTHGDDPSLRAGMSAIIDIDTGYERPAPGWVRALLPSSSAFAENTSRR
ncbi:MAG TPA: HlyD family secretion protein [Gammaproteobacteria bacterium]